MQFHAHVPEEFSKMFVILYGDEAVASKRRLTQLSCCFSIRSGGAVTLNCKDNLSLFVDPTRLVFTFKKESPELYANLLNKLEEEFNLFEKLPIECSTCDGKEKLYVEVAGFKGDYKTLLIIANSEGNKGDTICIW